ncbi:hypothetical protein GCM10009133_24500 [Cocleimonas flava]|uniref:Lipopolysaccharide kinase (Kdo/WaaP) family protein n=1 Tax=Cocleimonas flava TaxID=634765 RepID=A0A4R1ET68_9GAMM|nr:phosphotransferase [Cocleimonas flava]TCJ82984.1 lipopolysaccharide kinase (Kdo/WaaP) family protein [Cocleimonas flava]
MKSPMRWLKRHKELKKNASRRIEVEAALERREGQKIKLSPAAAKGGYDEIYYASKNGSRFAVVRINSEHKIINDPIGSLDPGIPLGPVDRLNREWDAYVQLAPGGLSPEPLWRSEHAIACSWLPWERLSGYLTKNRAELWKVLSNVFPLISTMHSLGVIHLDLNLGNILIDPNSEKLAVIDFEFGPVEWVNQEQQMAFDYLRLIDDCLKPRRGGKVLLEDPNKLIELLGEHVPEATRNADLHFVYSKLQRLQQQPELCVLLQTIFINLPDPRTEE